MTREMSDFRLLCSCSQASDAITTLSRLLTLMLFIALLELMDTLQWSGKDCQWETSESSC